MPSLIGQAYASVPHTRRMANSRREREANLLTATVATLSMFPFASLRAGVACYDGTNCSLSSS